ncbi:metalloregulator ArsR/SmtB family transcription factor [Nocardioides sp. SYSU D00038]|uniref:ArsR/SmtB family transcription factor n=1 Tax=Nocardioides sp. SYSU D00038 TaxID=2812554 RepID=UPI0027DD1141|nr:metalloregulator ArsR/SmtB family transcription factor [Nocardioides sp. SYSU D00038]
MDAFTALADPTRRALLVRVRRGPARVVDLAADHAMSRPAVSKHLRVLVEAGLLSVSERGRERHYALRAEGLAAVRRLLDELAPPAGTRLTGQALDALDTEVRRTVRQRRARPTTHQHEETA